MRRQTPWSAALLAAIGVFAAATAAPGIAQQPEPAAAAAPEGPDPAAPSLQRQLDAAEARFRERWGELPSGSAAPRLGEARENRAAIIVDTASVVREETPLEDPFRALLGDLTDDFSLSEAGAQAPEIEAGAARFLVALDRLGLAAGVEHSDFGIDYASYDRDAGVSKLAFLDLGRVLVIRALLDAARGQDDRAIAGIGQALELSRSFGSEPDSIMQILRVNLDRDALGVVRSLIGSRNLLPSDLGELLALVRQADSADAPAQWFRSRLMFNLTLAKKASTDRGQTLEDALLRQWNLAARLHMFDLTDAWMRYASTPRYDRGLPPEPGGWPLASGAGERLESQVEDAASDESEPTPEASRAAFIDLLTSGYGEQGAHFITRSDLNQARMGLARVALSLLRYAADHGGAFPRVAEDLVPRYLDALPLDPFTGVAFGYRPTPDGYRLVAGEEAFAAWDSPQRDPLLDWSRSSLPATE